MQESGTSFPSKMDHIKLLQSKGLEELVSLFTIVLEIAETIKANGGKALLVGGSVRDYFFGLIPKDYDLEVYNIEAERLKEIISPFGSVSEVGRSFGVLKLRAGLDDIDTSIPRIDSKTSEGHKGFSVNINPFLTVKEAAQRRDFTINSIAADPLTGEIFDEYDGLKDIKLRVLKVTHRKLFMDDPLRVLRAVQFIGRFGLSIEQNSRIVITETAKRLNEISSDRFFEEFKKLLIKSSKPSLGLMSAKSLGVFDVFFPHFNLMQQTMQDQEWHPEGDVWTHTLMVVDEASRVLREINVDDEKKIVIMLAALLHDVGKPETTFVNADNRVISPGHEAVGKVKAKEFLEKINVPNEIKEKVLKLVIYHMIPGQFYKEHLKGQTVTDSAIRRLATKLSPATIEDLIMVSHADSFGRSVDIDRSKYNAGIWLTELSQKIGVNLKQPDGIIKGRDLILQGFTPGKSLGDIISLSERIRNLQEELNLIDDAGFIVSKEYLLEVVKECKFNGSAIITLKKKAIEIISKIRTLRKDLRTKKS